MFVRSTRSIFALTLALSGCGSEALEAEDVAEAASEIVNGSAVALAEANNMGMVALYARTPAADGGPGPWWGRPCSGTVIQHIANSAYVLTARHCVTLSGAVDSEIMPASWLRVASGVNPGLPNPEPPASAKTVATVYAMAPSDPSIASWRRDAALLKVNAPDWGYLVSRKGVQMVPAKAGLSLTGYGYGLNVRNDNCYGNGSITTGAGTLRKATFTSLGGGTAKRTGWYSYKYNALGQSIICGDSGGSDIGRIAPDMPWSSVHGVHTGDTSEVQTNYNTAPGPWLAEMLGGFYLSPVSGTSWNLGRRADGVVYLVSPEFGVQLVYDPVLKVIRLDLDDDTECLEWDGGELDSFVLTTCNSSNRPFQKWEVTAEGYVRNAASNLCMRHMVSGWVEVGICPAPTVATSERARFTWVWHPGR